MLTESYFIGCLHGTCGEEQEYFDNAILMVAMIKAAAALFFALPLAVLPHHW